MNLYPDEPTFTLRAADKYAPKTILEWARSVLQSPDATREQFLKAAQAHQVAERMLYWQAEHPELVKVPDAVVFGSKIKAA